MRLGEFEKGENRTGELEEEHRSRFEAGGDADCGDEGRSSKKDLLPHTTADIVRSPSALCSFNDSVAFSPILYRSIQFHNCSRIDDQFVLKLGLAFAIRSFSSMIIFPHSVKRVWFLHW